MKKIQCPFLSAIFILLFLASCNLPAGRDDVPIEDPADDDIPLVELTGERDECLLGGWAMHTEMVDLLVATMVPMPGIRVPSGNLVMIFDPDGAFTYLGDLIIHIDMNPAENQYMEGQGSFTTRGTYSTEGNATLNFDFSESETEVFQWTGHKGSEEYSVPGGGPSFSLNPPGSAPYRCSENSLEIDSRNPAGDTITMFFEYNPSP